MATLKPQINGPLYCNTVIGTLALNGRAVTFCTARRGLGSLGPRPFSSNSPPFNGQCTNQLHIIWCGTMPLDSKGLNRPTVCHRFHQQKNKHNRRDKTLHHRLSLGYIRRCLLPPQVFFHKPWSTKYNIKMKAENSVISGGFTCAADGDCTTGVFTVLKHMKL